MGHEGFKTTTMNEMSTPAPPPTRAQLPPFGYLLVLPIPPPPVDLVSRPSLSPTTVIVLLRDTGVTRSRRWRGKAQRSAEKFAEEVLAPRVVSANRRGTFDRSVITEMGKAGLLGCTLQGYGCAGVGHVAYGLVARCEK